LTRRKPTANSGLAKGGLTDFEETFMLSSTVILRMNISAEFSALRQAANRYRQAQDGRQLCNKSAKE